MESGRRQSPESRERRAAPRARLRRLGALSARLAMDLLLIDAVVETWMSGSPIRLWVAGPVAVYLVLTAVALTQGSRLAAPGLVTQIPAPFYVLLGLLVATTEDRAGMTHGLVMLTQSTPAVLAAVTLVVTALAAGRFVVPRGLPIWLRAVVFAVGAYAILALGLAVRDPVPFTTLLHGGSYLERLPVYLQGAFVGGLVLVPAAFVRELGISMARVVLTGYLRWMLVFGLGAWIAINGFTV